jgi:hypothetical protein
VNVQPSSQPARTRIVLESLTAILVLACAVWNIWNYGRNADRLEPRETEDVNVQEADYLPIRELLSARYYDGPVGLINNRILAGLPSSPSDGGRMAQAQYVMIPRILVLQGRSVGGIAIPDAQLPFVIGDFWDAPPDKTPPDLVEIYRGERIFLFERKPQ